MGEFILSVLTTILLLSTILPFSRSAIWWIRGWEFPRLQLVALGGMLFLFELMYFDYSRNLSWAMSITVLVCTIYHSSWIFSYTRLHPFQVMETKVQDPENALSILVANVLQPNDCYEDLLKIIWEEGPHVLVTLETNKVWEEHLNQLESHYPYTVKCPLENLFGMHVYSKLPLIDPQIKFLVESDIPSIHTGIKLVSGKKISLHFLHPRPPTPDDTGESRQRDAELLVVGKSAVEEDVPVIVSGDLNDVAWSKTTKLFIKISRLLDPRIGRGMFNTYNAHHWFIRWPLDHLFHSNHFTLTKLKRLRAFGSDHFPVFIELKYDESIRKVQPPSLPDQDEDELALSKISISSSKTG